ncbi:hypothetical protein [Rhodococcus indonesiensis]
METSWQTLRMSLIAMFVTCWVGATGLLIFTTTSIYWVIALCLVGFVFVCVYLIVSYMVYVRSEGPCDPLPKIDSGNAVERAKFLAGTLGAQERMFFAQVILSPKSVIQRVGESVAPATRAYIVKTAYLFEVPSIFSGKSVAIPVTLRPKGRLMDHFQMTDDNGCRVSPLGQEDAIAYTLAALRALPATAQALAEYCDTPGDDGITIERRVAGLLCSDSTDEELQSIRGSIRNAGMGADIAELVFRMLTSLRRLHPVVAIIRVPESTHDHETVRIRLTIEQRVIPFVRRNESKLRWLRDNLRSILGVRPTVIGFPIEEARRARSYHLEVFGPEGTYLAKQAVYDPAAATDTPLAQIPHRFLARYGQRYGHFYAKKATSADDAKKLALISHFYERPPGSIAPATMSAFAAAFLIVAAAIVKLSATADLQSDIIAVLLALPVVASAWTGFDSSRSLFGGALNSRISLIVTMMLAFTTVALWIITENGEAVGRWQDRDYSWVWVAVSSAAVLNFTLSAFSWLLRSWVYGSFVKRELVKG